MSHEKRSAQTAPKGIPSCGRNGMCETELQQPVNTPEAVGYDAGQLPSEFHRLRQSPKCYIEVDPHDRTMWYARALNNFW